jgi:DNA invertase Pin-like site-specific DNA recombinase
MKERQAAGIAIARAKGKYKGQPLKLNAAQVEEIKAKVARGEKKAQIAREYKISTKSIYNYLEDVYGHKCKKMKDK